MYGYNGIMYTDREEVENMLDLIDTLLGIIANAIVIYVFVKDIMNNKKK